MNWIADYAVPLVVFSFIAFGVYKNIDVFDCFIQGAKSGIGVSFKIIPSLVALITAVGVLKASGALDMITRLLFPITSFFSMPEEVVPLAILRPISGSGALVIFNDLLARFGPDSQIGRIASVIEGSTETTFYTIAVYFGATSIKRTRHTVIAALIADLTGFAMSVLFVKMLFYQ